MKLLRKASIILVCLIVLFETFVAINKLSLLSIVINNVSSTNSKNGTIVVTVLESGSLAPIDNATVCIVETRKYFNTNSHGSTEKITAPILNSSPLNSIVDQNWGTITLLVYKPGYADTIIFNTAIFSDKLRIGMVVFLNPIINQEDNKPTIISENPSLDYVNKLIKLCKK